VDTLLIGAFVPDPACKCILYPSVEYIEAGRFKPSRSILNEINNDPKSNYKHFYDQKVKDPLYLNFGSIAMVCNIKSEKAK